MKAKVIISLFDYTGTWPEPFKETLEYLIYQVDIKPKHSRVPGILPKPGIDILTWDYKTDIPADKFNVIGILAAPPCTHYSGSGAQYWKAKDSDGRTAASNMLMEKTLEIVDYYKPKWWVMENPVGRLRRMLRGEYKPGEPQISVPDSLKDVVSDINHSCHPCDYGDTYTKKTLLWGEFNNALELNRVEPIRSNKQGSWLQSLGGKSERTKELRSITPPGFARAFFEANH